MHTTRSDQDRHLSAGAVVRTDDDSSSVAEVVHRNGAVTRLDRASEAVIDRIDAADRPRIVVTLGRGRTWHHTGPLDDPTIYEARCASAVATARFAVFSAVCRADGSVDIAAVRGNVVVRGMSAGSVAVSDGQQVTVSATGHIGPVVAAGEDDWAALNALLDDAPQAVEPQAAAPEEPAEPDAAAASEPLVAEAAPLPRWVSRTIGTAVAAGFTALLLVTFLTAEQGDNDVERAAGDPPVNTSPLVVASSSPVPLPAGAAAIIRAAQDRSVAPEPRPAPTTTTTTVRVRYPEPVFTPPTTAAPAPAPVPAPAPTASAKGASCSQRSGTLVFSGTIKNTGTTASGFAVDTAFSRNGARFSSASATVGTLAPGATATWQVKVPAPKDVRGVSCDVAATRPL